ncbi:MAG: hypothetical protein CMN54_10680, partial [SAR324 cluster bacterium]|nr:hypothetical protein [SAR324 cluster bacterium]
MKNILIQLMLIASLGLIQTGCDLREGTIVYDVDFPRADSDEAQGGDGDDGGSGDTPTVTLSTSAANIAENSGTVTVT